MSTTIGHRTGSTDVLLSDLPPDLPPRPTEAELRGMGKLEARGLSDALFARLGGLARESAAYCCVRGTIIELNMPLVRFIGGRFRHRVEDMDDMPGRRPGVPVDLVGRVARARRWRGGRCAARPAGRV
ncbi:hypothetical protein ABT095_01375 [Kitasatospora sp. NPDC002227]|uniref:hypothetical protein n=1 Tax=Kitasatospora sp. NPDC002227 TaxID=3154773 RepID=UPI003320C60F